MCWLLTMPWGALESRRTEYKVKDDALSQTYQPPPWRKKAMVLILGEKTDFSATIRFWRRLWSKALHPVHFSLVSMPWVLNGTLHTIMTSHTKHVEADHRVIHSQPLHSFEAEMWTSPIFQQLVRLSVAQRGKLRGKTVVTFLLPTFLLLSLTYMMAPPQVSKWAYGWLDERWQSPQTWKGKMYLHHQQETVNGN